MKKIILILLLIIVFSGCIEESVTGKYVLNNESYIKLNTDGTFQQKGIRYHMPFAAEGTYTIDKSNITLHYPYGFFSEFTKNETGLIASDGVVYEKQK